MENCNKKVSSRLKVQNRTDKLYIDCLEDCLLEEFGFLDKGKLNYNEIRKRSTLNESQIQKMNESCLKLEFSKICNVAHKLFECLKLI